MERSRTLSCTLLLLSPSLAAAILPGDSDVFPTTLVNDVPLSKLDAPLLEARTRPGELLEFYAWAHAEFMDLADAFLRQHADVIGRYDALHAFRLRAPVDNLLAVAGHAAIWKLNTLPSMQSFLDTSRPLVQADRVYDELGITGRNVTIAFIDTGIDSNHPDFKLQTGDCPGKFILFPITNKACSRIVAFQDMCSLVHPQGDGLDIAYDDHGHGTHVAGIAAGNGAGHGGFYRGIAPDARIVMVRAFTASGTSAGCDLLGAINWVVANRTKFNITVFSNSWGCIACLPTGQDAGSLAMAAAHDSNITVMAAAGNFGVIACPACHPKVIAVGATNDQKQVQLWSGKGSPLVSWVKPDVVAPGVGVWAPKNYPLCSSANCRYIPHSGTSMATPHVGGMAALLLEANRTLNSTRVGEIIRRTAEGLPFLNPVEPDVPNHASGWGFIRAYDGVQAALNGTVFAPPPTESPPPPDPGTLQGRVYNASDINHSLSNVRIELFTVPGAALANSTVTATDGTFSLTAGAGNYTVRLIPPPGALFFRKDVGPVEIFTDLVTTQNFSLSGGGVLEVFVQHNTTGVAQALNDSLVQVVEIDDPANAHAARTGLDGLATFQLRPGVYRILAEGNNTTPVGYGFENRTIALWTFTSVGIVLSGEATFRADAGGSRSVTVDTPVMFDGRFSLSYPGAITGWLWKFGDGSNSTQPFVEHTFTDIGTYFVNLTVTNSTGMKASDVITVYVNRPGYWNTRILYTDPPADEGVMGVSTLVTSGRWPWADFVRHAVSQNGSDVVVHLKVKDLGNASGRFKYETNTVFGNLCATHDFSTGGGSIGFGCKNYAYRVDTANDTIEFLIARTAIGVTHNGALLLFKASTSTDMTIGSPTMFVDIDYMGKQFIVQDVPGVGWFTRASNEPPIADFTFTPAVANIGQWVRFTDASTDLDGSPVAWDWSFGDGFVSARRSPLHSYAQGGCFFVKLLASDAKGGEGQRIKTVLVRYANGTAPGPEACQATARLRGQVVNASAPSQGVADVSVSIVRTDGTTASTVTNATGEYRLQAPPGTYSLRASPPSGSLYLQTEINGLVLGDNTTTLLDVLLTGAGVLIGQVTNNTGAGLPVRVLVENASMNYLLAKFSDDSGNYRLLVRPGTQNVSFAADPDLLLETRLFAGIAVGSFESVVLNASLPLQSLLVSKPVPRQSNVTGVSLSFGSRSLAQPDAITSASWEWGDGEVSTMEGIHTYDAPGVYDVNLTVTNSTGVVDKDTVQVFVGRPGQWNYRRLAEDPALDAAAAYQDLRRFDVVQNRLVLEFHLKVRDLAAISSETKYTVQFRTPVQQTACAILNETTVTIPSGCVNAIARRDTANDTVALGVLCSSIGLSDCLGRLTEAAATTFDVPTALLGDRAPDTGSAAYSLVSPDEAPVPWFTWSPANPTTTDWVQFTDLTSDYDGQAYTWTWFIDDVVHSTAQDFAMRFIEPREYLVKLESTDNSGNVREVVREVVLAAPS